MNVLEDVLTIREVAQRWGLHPTTVRRAIDAGRLPLTARKSPDDVRGTWLITRASVERRWGKPRARDCQRVGGQR
jgi:excisionase family DNA binding protein